MIAKILVSLLIVVLAGIAIRKSRRHSPSTPAAPRSPGWAKFGWLMVICLAIGFTAVGIYWGVQKINHGMPEREESTAYYQYWIEYANGRVRQGDPVLVRITPEKIGAGYTSVDGGSVTLRWTRGGDGVWTRIFGQKTFGSWLRIKNVSNDPKADFEEWKHKILGEIGDDTDPAKSYKISLTR